MRFFDREVEIEELRAARAMSQINAQFTVVTGRRRIGKTTLIRKAYEDSPFLYFFVARKSEKELCSGYLKEIEQRLDIPMIGATESFAEIFEYLMKLSLKQSFTLVIDEFQEFYRVNASVYSEMQKIWDVYHEDSKINLVVCGSIFSMMVKIFMDDKEPLYNRENRFMKIKPFGPSVLKEILKEYHPDYNNEDLLALYAFTGGVAKYIQLLIDSEAYTPDKMINRIVNPSSIFIGEGKAILIEEFGKDYGTYFSILSAIAKGKTSRAEIEDTVGKEVGGYLTKLEENYEIIKKIHPAFESNPKKNIHYVIEDNFFLFWFRYIYRYGYMIEIEAYEGLREVIMNDYNIFSGLILERYFKQLLIESKSFTRIGSWWDRKGVNEIDIIGENELRKELTFIEVKRNRDRYRESLLRKKAEVFFNSVGDFKGYEINYKGISMEDM